MPWRWGVQCYLIVVIVMVDMVPMEAYSQIGSDGVHVDGLQLPSFEAGLLVIRQRDVPAEGVGCCFSDQILCYKDSDAFLRFYSVMI